MHIKLKNFKIYILFNNNNTNNGNICQFIKNQETAPFTRFFLLNKSLPLNSRNQ